MSEIPETPAHQFSGIVVDINLRSPESVQRVRNKLRGEAYRSLPRLFVLADALHHASMQAWALGATDTISRPFDAASILQRVRAAFPDSTSYDATDRGKALNRGVDAAARGDRQDVRKTAGRRAADIRRCRAGRKQDSESHQAHLAARMADYGRLPSRRQLSALPVCHRLCGGVRAKSRHARRRPAPADARSAAARCRQGVHPGGDPGQAGQRSASRR